MIAKERVAAGALRYIDCEVCPHIPGFKAIALSGLAALRQRPAVAALDVMTEDGMVDVDAIYSAFAPKITAPVELPIPMIGSISLDRAEIDKLYRYIKEA